MPTTPNMNLVLPTVSSTTGPDWADQLNAAFSLIDSHDHSSGEGVPITPAGMNISSNLTFNNFYATSVGSLRLTNQSATLSTPSDVRAVYSVNGDLYYNNSAGAAIQITSGGSVIAASDGIARSFSRTAVASNTIISAAATVSYYDVDTTTSVTFTLPAANAVSAGRFYEFKDTTGQAATNNIVINRAGADTIDGTTSFTISYNYGGVRLISDGTSKWTSNEIKTNEIATAMLKDSVVTTPKIQDSAVTTAKINNNAITQAKRAALGQQLSSESIFSTTSTSFVDVTGLSITITTTGRPVFVGIINSATGTPATLLTRRSSGAEASSQFQILRDSTVVAQYIMSLVVGGHASLLDLNTPASSVWTIDVPAAGTYTYKVQSRVVAATSVATSYTKLIAYEL